MIKFVELRCDLSQVLADMMRRICLGREQDSCRKTAQQLDERKLFGMLHTVEWCLLQILRVNSLLLRKAQNACNTGMRILHVVDRILLRLLLGKRDIKL